ncbi:hypothetical protein CC2G_011591 [Coprinopsis cinerea AmutBmut pab1-1]|nr:hypothetical protein CC2G_011591 [Coprinopsis cinerea AmutBmut pab1-1]
MQTAMKNSWQPRSLSMAMEPTLELEFWELDISTLGLLLGVACNLRDASETHGRNNNSWQLLFPSHLPLPYNDEEFGRKNASSVFCTHSDGTGIFVLILSSLDLERVFFDAQ